jgi:hypothetical protein
MDPYGQYPAPYGNGTQYYFGARGPIDWNFMMSAAALGLALYAVLR